MIEVDPRLKDELYIELARRRLTLKAWFVIEAEQLLGEDRRSELVAVEASTKHLPALSGAAERSEKS